MKNQRALRWLYGELPGLVEKGVLSPDAAAAIHAHYGDPDSSGARNAVMIGLAALGSTLIGAGIILLLAHNWENFGRPVRTLLSFLPLAIATGASFWALMRRNESTAWAEGAGTFHVAAIGASISLVAQTYHIAGDFAGFMLTWALLALPLVYLLRAVTPACLYIAGITSWLACDVSFFSLSSGWRLADGVAVWLWLLLLALVVPFYVRLLKENRFSVSSGLLSWVITVCTSLALVFNTERMADEWRAPAFAGLAGLFYVLACGWFAGRLHPFRIVGATGIAVAAIVLSYSESWHYWRTAHAWSANLVAVALVLSATVLAAWLWRRKADINVVACLLPLVATAVAMAGMDKNFAAGVMNFYAFALGAFTLWRGVGSDRLGAVNSGMLILSALLIARFFDSDLGFVVRGVGFILVGAGFLAVNIFILRRRKEGRP